MMNEPSSQYEASSGYAASLQPEDATNEQRPPLGNPGSTGRLMQEAMSSCEFSDTFVAGLPVRRQGQGIKLSYDMAMDMLGFGGGSNGYAD